MAMGNSYRETDEIRKLLRAVGKALLFRAPPRDASLACAFSRVRLYHPLSVAHLSSLVLVYPSLSESHRTVSGHAHTHTTHTHTQIQSVEPV
jgi:hypothetical protein